MRVLVTGASGRIGRAAVRALANAGHTVHGLDRVASRDPSAAAREWVAAFDDRARVAAALAGTEAVLHLGAFMSWRADDRDELYRANVDGTRILLEEAAAAGVRRFVFASSGEVYPETAPATLPITEDHPTRPNSPYGLTKLLGEELVRFFERTGAFETVILRFAHTQDAAELLDPGSFFSGPRFFLRPRIRQQEAFGNHAVADILKAADPGAEAHVLARNGEGRPFRMHITDTRDMVAGLRLALEHPSAADGTFNLGASEPVDFAELLPDMARITGLPVVTVDLPGPGVWYQTSNEKVRTQLGFAPAWTIDRMLEEAGEAWRRRTR